MLKRLTGKGKMKLAYFVALVAALVASATINVSHSEAGALVYFKDIKVHVDGDIPEDYPVNDGNYKSKVIREFSLPQGQVFSGWVTPSNFSLAALDGYPSGWYAEVRLSGSNDGVNWVNLGRIALDGSRFSKKEYSIQISDAYKYLRVILSTTADGSSKYYADAKVYGDITFQIYSSVADQESVEQARDAAIQARDNTQAAVDAARQAQQAAEEVNTIVNSTLTVNAGVVQDANGTVLSAARAAQQAAQQANSKLDNITNTLNQVQNNIQNINQYLPPTLHKISGLNGANATSSGSLQVVIDASNATQYRYKIDGGGWSPWMPLSEVVSIPVPKGVHTLTVQVANGSVGTPGPTAQESIQVIGL